MTLKTGWCLGGGGHTGCPRSYRAADGNTIINCPCDCHGEREETS